MNKKEILNAYKKTQKPIKKRLKSFQSLSIEQQYKEFLFCLLTPQSNAKKCWEAVEQLSKISSPLLSQITHILSTRTRFHNTKAKRVEQAPVIFKSILPYLSNTSTIELRNQIAEKVNGYGLKEAGHFLRNIGLSNNKISILDRHILRNINEDKIKSKSHYLKLEQKFLNLASSLSIPPDELDLLFWSKENGEIFK